METKSQRRKAPRERRAACILRVEIKDGLNNTRVVTADLIDLSSTGAGITIMAFLRTGATIILRGKIGDNQTEACRPACVRWCAEVVDGKFCAGIEFLDNGRESNPSTDPKAAARADSVEEIDQYEVLQVSSTADAETIARVYRFLAQRFHPDNKQSGNAEMFIKVSEAHEILGDPARRAAYDAQYTQTKRLRWKIFDQAATTIGAEAEKRKRHGILGLLYAKTLHDPEQAAMNIHSFEDLLGVPREHLQAALWYLVGKGYIKRSDNGRYSITVQGFEQAEAALPQIGPERQLPEAR